MAKNKIKIGIDIDDTITATIESMVFFSLITNSLKDKAKIYIITNRDKSKESIYNIEEELSHLNIYFDELIVTAKKEKAILDNSISIYFDDTDEYFQNLPETVTVFKIRESGNFDFNKNKWVYDKNTGIDIG